MGERSSSLSGSGWSPAAKRFLVQFRLFKWASCDDSVTEKNNDKLWILQHIKALSSSLPFLSFPPLTFPPFRYPAIPSSLPLQAARGAVERCELPQWGVGEAPTDVEL